MTDRQYDDLPAVWDAIHAKEKRDYVKPTNHAALQKEKGAPLTVDEAPLPVPGSGQVLVKVGAIAMNPADWAVRDMGILIDSWPAIFGCDAAGTVVEVGRGIKQISVGDRVFGVSMFMQHGSQHAAFQEYMLMQWPLIGCTPDNVSDAEAATISLGTATAADGMFRSLELDLPKAERVPANGSTVIVWGASTSVGSCGVQMLVAAGYEVVATASPRNFDFVKGLGASHVVNYNSPSVVQELMDAVKGKKVAGAYSAWATEQSIKALCQVVAGTPDAVKHVISVFPGTEQHALDGVKVTYAESTVCAYTEVGPYIWGRFLPAALGNGTMKARPEPKVVGHGLEAINGALDTLKGGVSATKLVVTL